MHEYYGDLSQAVALEILVAFQEEFLKTKAVGTNENWNMGVSLPFRHLYEGQPSYKYILELSRILAQVLQDVSDGCNVVPEVVEILKERN
jgi:hypothetical protein